MKAFLDRFFSVSERKSNIRTEIVAGMVTFMTVAYILVINPSILSVSGMAFDRVFAATAIISAVATLFMGIVFPLSFPPGWG